MHRRCLLAALLVLTAAVCSCGGGGGSGQSTPSPSPAPAPSGGEIFISHVSTPAVLVFPRTGTGDIAPTRELRGASTQLSGPRFLVVDAANDELIVANDASITVYGANASGNTAPIRVLAGPSTGLTDVLGLAVSTTRGELYALNASGIKVFLRTAAGDNAPIRTISPPIGFASLSAFAFDPVNDEFFVMADTAGTLSTTQIAILPGSASGSVAPSRVLQTSCTPLGVGVDAAAGELFVFCRFFLACACLPGQTPPPPRTNMLVFARTASGSASATRQRSEESGSASFGRIAVMPASGEITWVGSSMISTQATSFSGNTKTISGALTTLADLTAGGGSLSAAVRP